MKEAVKFIRNDNLLIIHIRPYVNPSLAMGSGYKAGFLFTIVTFLFYFTMSKLDKGWEKFLAILYAILLLMIVKNFLNSIISKEIIEVSKDKLAIVNKHLTYKEFKIFKLSEITDLSYVGERAYTPHPLQGTTTDYFGFGVQEKVVQAAIDDGTISLFSAGSTVRFGKNVTSWDAEIIVNSIKAFTGKELASENKIRELMADLEKEE